jgi:circadian clock protein KaiA
LHPQLSICFLTQFDSLAQSLRQHLGDKRYALIEFRSETEFLDFVIREKRQIDCLILQASSNLDLLLKQLKQQAVLLPAVILDADVSMTAVAVAEADERVAHAVSSATVSYHQATVRFSDAQIDQIEHLIDRAIDDFLALSLPEQDAGSEAVFDPLTALTAHNSLKLQQKRLAEKLKERLGYLGVYYKRNPQNFYRHMTQSQQQELLRQLKAEYREIVLRYFSDDFKLNERIDNFVNIAFFADISVPQIVEIHMDLIDEFSKQLKLEGRSDEVLLDYRLTLIDAVAHLCEMYRRSIPRES